MNTPNGTLNSQARVLLPDERGNLIEEILEILDSIAANIHAVWVEQAESPLMGWRRRELFTVSLANIARQNTRSLCGRDHIEINQL